MSCEYGIDVIWAQSEVVWAQSDVVWTWSDVNVNLEHFNDTVTLEVDLSRLMSKLGQLGIAVSGEGCHLVCTAIRINVGYASEYVKVTWVRCGFKAA